jgi:hypothetical protein
MGYVHEPLEVYYPTEHRTGIFNVCLSSPDEYENKSCAWTRSILGVLGWDDHNSYLDKTTKSNELPDECDAEPPSFTIPSVFYLIGLYCIVNSCFGFCCRLCMRGAKRGVRECVIVSANCYYDKWIPFMKGKSSQYQECQECSTSEEEDSRPVERLRITADAIGRQDSHPDSPDCF